MLLNIVSSVVSLTTKPVHKEDLVDFLQEMAKYELLLESKENQVLHHAVVDGEPINKLLRSRDELIGEIQSLCKDYLLRFADADAYKQIDFLKDRKLEE